MYDELYSNHRKTQHSISSTPNMCEILYQENHGPKVKGRFSILIKGIFKLLVIVLRPRFKGEVFP